MKNWSDAELNDGGMVRRKTTSIRMLAEVEGN